MTTDVTARAHLYHLADAFDREPRELYIDWMHITPEGNRIAAGAIAATLKAAAPRVASGFTTNASDRVEN